MFPSYRNQSFDLLCKSTGWFLYDGNIDEVNASYLQSFYVPDIKRMFDINKKQNKI